MENNPRPQIRPKAIDDDGPSRLAMKNKKKCSIKWILLIIGGILLTITAFTAVFGAFALRPVDEKDISLVTVEIVSGTSPDQIGKILKDNQLIRNEIVFSVYARAKGVHNNLKAGTYQLSKSQSLSEIVDSLAKGPEIKEFEVTFLPGGTLLDHKKVLLNVGFSEEDVDAAFAKKYNHPLFATQPDDADIEGYIFGETHRFVEGTTLDAVLNRYFDDFYEVVQKNNLVEKYKEQGLSLYEGITLASIIQRESGGEDKAQIAQVFYLRLRQGMSLGSDVTYQYIADKLGLARDVDIDSPYNTRLYAGLPPGPIASPGVDALLAVASPAEGSYLYFLSGDDGVTYFATTLEGHNENVRNHCQSKCQIL